MATLDRALDFLRLGVSIVPIRADGSKGPARSGWADLQRHRMSAEEAREIWTRRPKLGLGVIGGTVSGGLECLDFDSVHAWDLYVQACADAGLGEALDRVRAGYEERSPRGVHLLWRSPARDGSLKLARIQGHGGIETRGEGGYVIVAPSSGTVHDSGEPYTLIQGGPESIVWLSAEEREDLLRVARALHTPTREEAARAEVRPHVQLAPDGSRPGDQMNESADWPSILEPHGWRRVYARDGVTYWRRPGKSRGISASTGWAGTHYLYVWSTSTIFEAERGYSPFSAWALLEHDGDFAAAARELAAEGYAETEPPPAEGRALANRLVARHRARPTARAPRTPPAPITASEPAPERAAPTPTSWPPYGAPGPLGELYDWALDGAPIPQPHLLMGATLVTCAAILGRSACTADARTWPNLYALLLAETGAGKSYPGEMPRRTLRALGAGERAIGGVTGEPALASALVANPARVMYLDEFGRLLGADSLSSGGRLIRALTLMYEASRSEYAGDYYADDQRRGKSIGMRRIAHPCLSVVAAATPGQVYRALGDRDADDGVLNRWSLWQGDPAARMRRAALSPLPLPLRSHLGAWIPQRLPGLAAHLPTEHPEPGRSRYAHTRGALECLDAHSQEADDARIAAIGQGDRIASSSRARQASLAERLALLQAAIRQGPQPEGEISRADAEWACAWARALTDDAVATWSEHLGRTEESQLVERIAEWLRARGPASRRDVGKKFRRLDKRAVDEALAAGESTDALERIDSGRSYRGRRIYLWRAAPE